jgi:hypothetical protein
MPRLKMTSVSRVLGSAANRSPIGKGFQVMAVFPGEHQKLAGAKASGFFAEKSLKPPLDVGAFPGLKAVAG